VLSEQEQYRSSPAETTDHGQVSREGAASVAFVSALLDRADASGESGVDIPKLQSSVCDTASRTLWPDSPELAR
jgi:hypothetical protein